MALRQLSLGSCDNFANTYIHRRNLHPFTMAPDKGSGRVVFIGNIPYGKSRHEHLSSELDANIANRRQ